MFELMFHHDLLDGAGANLRATTVPLFESLVALVEQASDRSDDSRMQAPAIQTGRHGIAVLSSNRALELVGSRRDIPVLVERAVSAHL
ncbi:hypothetical protein FK531_03800 [Rhodococcus spelaei]|uniref:Uncharacterized protein n=1 Tax=Rhodococcus spelaei TaxID=2546320 RepID=A0A541BS70_9NOCA|nr:hypothetical protein [Rhodococcus spelaei]TQF75177.1 hypothetical protein FK531_03800 [Rhodococcus spelaei]